MIDEQFFSFLEPTRFRFEGEICESEDEKEQIVEFEKILLEIDPENELLGEPAENIPERAFDLQLELDNLAPPGLFFGRHPSDPERFGFWSTDLL